MATTLSSLNSLPIADVGTRSENWALMINNLFSYINTLEAGTATHPNVVTAALKLTTGGGANKILTSDADGDASWASALPTMSAIETGTLKVTTGAAANKILVSDADGDLTYSNTPTLSTLEVGTVKITGGSPGAGKLLQSDADGDASWATVSGGDFSNGGEAGGAARTLGNTDSYSLGLETNNTTRLLINSTGEVGIGGTAASNEFLVAVPSGGNLEFNAGGNSRFEISDKGAIRSGLSLGTLNQAGFAIDIGDATSPWVMMECTSARADAMGQLYRISNRSPSPANSDDVWKVDVFNNSVDTTYRTRTGMFLHRITDVGTLGGDGLTDGYQSEWRFYVCNSENASGAVDDGVSPNTYGQVRYDGAYVQNSAGATKSFEEGYTHRWPTICGQLESLRLVPYHPANDPDGPTISFGTSAEEWYETFGIGEAPALKTNQDGEEEYSAGIAANEVAMISLAAVKELHARLKALEEA